MLLLCCNLQFCFGKHVGPVPCFVFMVFNKLNKRMEAFCASCLDETWWNVTDELNRTQGTADFATGLGEPVIDSGSKASKTLHYTVSEIHYGLDGHVMIWGGGSLPHAQNEYPKISNL